MRFLFWNLPQSPETPPSLRLAPDRLTFSTKSLDRVLPVIQKLLKEVEDFTEQVGRRAAGEWLAGSGRSPNGKHQGRRSRLSWSVFGSVWPSFQCSGKKSGWVEIATSLEALVLRVCWWGTLELNWQLLGCEENTCRVAMWCRYLLIFVV